MSSSFVQLINEHLQLTICPVGAELIKCSNKEGKNFLWSKDEKIWNRVSPVLFPIVGRLKDNFYHWDEKKYCLSQHGFARDLAFRVIEQSSNFAAFELKASEETLSIYPFDFCLKIRYELHESSVKTAFEIKNAGSTRMPFSIGGHPGFSLSDTLDQYELHFPSAFEADRLFIKNGLFSGVSERMKIDKVFPLNTSHFEQDALVFRDPPFEQIALYHKEEGFVLQLQCSDWTAVGIWTKPEAPFICLEPWWGWADDETSTQQLVSKKGMHWLLPNESKEMSYEMSFAN